MIDKFHLAGAWLRGRWLLRRARASEEQVLDRVGLGRTDVVLS